MAEQPPLFGALAVRMGLITQAQLGECIALQREGRAVGYERPLGRVLVEAGYLTEAQLATVLKLQADRSVGEALRRSAEGAAAGAPSLPEIPGYELLSKLGQGAAGAVYRARHLALDMPVAVKVLKPELTRHQDYVQRFFREAKAAALLNHPNIVRAIDAGRAAAVCYLVMEFVDGLTLRRVLADRGKLSEPIALALLEQTASALDHAWSRKIVHRDIKPENIMVMPRPGAAGLLDGGGIVKVTDLGLAKAVDEAGAAGLQITRQFTSIGTPDYMSPEQAKGQPNIDCRSDIYSLGATIYHCVTGQPPFVGQAAMQVMLMHVQAPIPDARRSIPALSESLADMLRVCMAKEPAQRYQTPAHLLEALGYLRRAAAEAAATAAWSPPPPPAARPPPNVASQRQAAAPRPAPPPSTAGAEDGAGDDPERLREIGKKLQRRHRRRL